MLYLVHDSVLCTELNLLSILTHTVVASLAKQPVSIAHILPRTPIYKCTYYIFTVSALANAHTITYLIISLSYLLFH